MAKSKSQVKQRVKELRWVRAADLAPHESNWRQHPPYQRAALQAMLDDVGIANAVIAYESSEGRLTLIDGHLRRDMLPDAVLPVLVLDVDETEARKLLLTLDPLAAMAQPDMDVLMSLLQQTEFQDQAVKDMLEALVNGETVPLPNLYANTGEGIDDSILHVALALKFLVPPFSVLDARQGYWQKRKGEWLALGIRSELGRGEATSNGEGLGRVFGQDLMRGEHVVEHRNLTWVQRNTEELPLDETSRKILAAGPRSSNTRKAADMRSNIKDVSPLPYWAEAGTGTTNMAPGTSIFDPVLCELAYRWFCPAGGLVLDPFAGGSVRGIVAAILGYRYKGIDLRLEQKVENETQAQRITPAALPQWIVGDAKDIAVLAPGRCDFVFSCPPYFNLELYSDDPRDLSNSSDYQSFLVAYRHIIAEACQLLDFDRFACFCVGDIRDRRGVYRNFVSDTIQAFQDAGMSLYNEAILVTAVGSLPLRVGRQFGRYRKLGKTHQNILVFYKGDITHIPDVFGTVDVTDALTSFDLMQG